MHVMIYSIDFAVNMATTTLTIVTEEPAAEEEQVDAESAKVPDVEERPEAEKDTDAPPADKSPGEKSE